MPRFKFVILPSLGPTRNTRENVCIEVDIASDLNADAATMLIPSLVAIHVNALVRQIVLLRAIYKRPVRRVLSLPDLRNA